MTNRPELRRATRNMVAALEQVEALLATLPDGWLDAHRAIPVVVGTDDGELATTTAFLETLGRTGVARPFLFQSSLHHATLGFLSERLGLRGPGFTVCPAADAPALAEELLDDYDEVLVITADGDTATAGIARR